MKKIILSFVAIFFSVVFVNGQTEIWNAEDFQQVINNPSGNFIQKADITFSSQLTESVVANFSGVYDGGGYKITYNAVYPNNYFGGIYGLFSVNNGTIKNLKITANVSMSGVANQVGLICGRNNGTISNCEIVNGVISAETGARYSGLIAGTSMGTSAVINSCSVFGQIFGTQYVGGVVGRSSGVIKACEFNGTIYSNGYSETDDLGDVTRSAYVGGIVAMGDVLSSYAEPVIYKPSISMNLSAYYGITPNTAIGCVVGSNGRIDGAIIGENKIAGTIVSQGITTCFIAPLTSNEVSLLNTYATNNNATGIDWTHFQEIEIANSTYTVVNNGYWGARTTWQGGNIPDNLHNVALPTGGVTIVIPSGKTVKLNRTLVLTNNIRLQNNGTLYICEGGDLVNTTSTAISGNIVVEKNVNANRWYLTAAPFTNYNMSVVEIPATGANADVAAIAYDYSSGSWASNYMTIQDNMGRAESFFMWPFYTGQINFVSNGCSLNNGDFSVTKSITQYTDGGYWMALANPYPGNLDIQKFVNTSGLNIQGVTLYGYESTGGYFVTKSIGEVKVTEGFFVNVGSTGSKTAQFKKTQMKNYPSSSNKNSVNQEREFIDFALEYENKSIKVHFAQNDEAEQTYDIFDANKLFATTGVIEPYFVTDGIELAKEEVKELPYYATLNIRSTEEDTVRLVAKNIPEGYTIALIDGEESIDMVEGDMYETVVVEGENADRFKLLVKKSLSLSDVAESELSIINDNRQVNILTQEKVSVEVYNALGQKVYQTNNSSFVLNDVPAGAYVVKAYVAGKVETAKIIIK